MVIHMQKLYYVLYTTCHNHKKMLINTDMPAMIEDLLVSFQKNALFIIEDQWHYSFTSK